MKILWIEDFGGNQPSAEKLSKAIFKTILSKDDDELTKIYDEYDQDRIIDNELPKLFQKNSIHEIVICRTFKYWNDNIKTTFDFDVILIDINLAKGSSPDDIPIGYGNDFHNKAGFYIYQEIIKFGLPDDNIAFFTGETGSFQGFKESCISNSIPFPQNIFEKKSDDYKKIGDWLEERSETDYLILRRAIINGCTEISELIDNENNIIFNKTLHKNMIFLTKDDIVLYLNKLKYFYPKNSLSEENKKQKYYSFVKELSDLWERSFGYFSKESKYELKKDKSPLVYNFLSFCQNQMKLLRNWTAHNQLSKELTEKELAFYFMIAMRALFNLKVDKIYDYEKILLTLFGDNNIEQLVKSDVKKELAESYFKVRNVFEKKEYNLNNPTNNTFIDLLKNLGELTKNKFLHSKKKYAKELKSNSIKWFYQNFWHGIFPAQFSVFNPCGKEIIEMNIKFDIECLDKFDFLEKLAKSIYSETFRVK